ncbi:MAG: hypothetical protein V2I36_07995 [Desulfopila sp.]|jgi:hypothetical protein|nr:hypothetical protein [Desulfopila sp.]
MHTKVTIRTAGAMMFLFMLFNLFPGKPATAHAAEGLKGWEAGSAYNDLYNPKERDSLKGKVVRFTEVTPLPGMDPGTALILQESGDDNIVVHLCPETYASAKETGIKIGDQVKVKGSWAEIDGEDVYIAAKVKKGDHFEFKVRLTSDGTPFWTMTPEQLKKEKNSE